MRLKKCNFGYNTKAGKSDSVVSKRKIAENLQKIDRHWPKIGLNINFLENLNSSSIGTNMYMWF